MNHSHMHNYKKKKKKKNKTISTKLQNTIPIVQQSKNRTLPIKIESTKELPKQNTNGLYLIRKQSLLALNPTQNHRSTDTEWWLDSKLGRVAYRYERLMGLCFQCGRVGHEATRCIHPYDGATANRPYGDWLRAGTKPRTDGSRGNTDRFSFPH